MSKNPPPDERVIYLALKNVFQGPNAKLRKRATIRKLIREANGQDDIADLLREHNPDVLCKLTQKLLSQNIFESTLNAKLRFPELFDTSPTQSAEDQASEAEAARHEADAIEQAARGGWSPIGPTGQRRLTHAAEGK